MSPNQLQIVATRVYSQILKSRPCRSAAFGPGGVALPLLLVFGWMSVCHAGQDTAPKSDENTLALWHLDEVIDDTTPDASARGHGGRLHGPTLTNEGRFGNALVFDGQGDHVDCGPGPDLGGGDFTVEAWFRTTHQTGQYGCILGLYGSADVWLAMTKEGGIRFGFRDPAGNTNEQQLTGRGLNLNDGRYHHVAGVRAGICTIAVPMRIFVVWAAIQARGEMASEP